MKAVKGMMKFNHFILTNILLGTLLLQAISLHAAPWKRHTIDRSSRGADGVRLADVNQDSKLDLVTGWEEGGVIRVYLNPGPEASKKNWPAVTVGKVKSPEDAFFVDLDHDGAIDVVSCCEGKTKTVFVHWAPKDPKRYLDPSAWNTEPIPCTENKQLWMYGFAMEMDDQSGIDLIVGSKGKNASVSWLQAPENPRDLEQWKLHRLSKAGWIMSLESYDLDQDKDLDIIFSDRKGDERGLKWLENCGKKNGKPVWKEHQVGLNNHEVMFLDIFHSGPKKDLGICVAGRNKQILFAQPENSSLASWHTKEVPNPYEILNGKAVRVVDIDLDGSLDIVHTANTYGNRSTPGVCWMKTPSLFDGPWKTHDISGSEGVKFDLIQMHDLDADGDLDLLTCEERDNLGVIWYENPAR